MKKFDVVFQQDLTEGNSFVKTRNFTSICLPAAEGGVSG